MPDIAMCSNTQCPLRKKCYRYTAEPNSWQTYGTFKFDKEENNCRYFWDNKGYQKRENII